MGLFKEIVKGFAEGYVSERGIDGTLEDLSDFASKIFGTNDSNTDNEWERTFNEISSLVDEKQFQDALNLLDNFYDSNNLDINFNYSYIVSQIVIEILKFGNFEEYDENKVIEIGKKRVAEAADLASTPEEREIISEIEKQLLYYIEEQQSMSRREKMIEGYFNIIDKPDFEYTAAFEVLKIYSETFGEDFFYCYNKLDLVLCKISQPDCTYINSSLEEKIEKLIKKGFDLSTKQEDKDNIESMKQFYLERSLNLKIDDLTTNSKYDEALDLVEKYRQKGLNSFKYRELKRLVIQRRWRATPITDANYSELENQVLSAFDAWRKVCKTDEERNVVEDTFNNVYPTIKAEKEQEAKLVNTNPNSKFSANELEYMDEYKNCLADGNDISEKERRLLNKLANSLNISPKRVEELEELCTNPSLSAEEKEYLEEYRACIDEDGNISDKERRLLDKLAKSLGLSQDIVNRLESSIK